MLIYNPDSLRVLRLSKGLSRDEFAKMVGGKVTRQHVYNWETKGKLPQTKNLLKIAEAFDLDTLDIFFLVEHYHSNNRQEA